MFKQWSNNLEKSMCSFFNPNGGVTTQDPETLEIIYIPSEPIVIEGVKLDLTANEKVARQQLQDDSTFKIVIEDKSEYRIINNTYEVTVDTIKYKITGIKKPKLPNSLITIYIKE